MQESGVTSNVARVSRMILNDILRRGLSVGQPYLTAQAAGEIFGYNPQLVGRAMRVLARRGILVRKPGVGTFVGPSAHAEIRIRQHCVHILVPIDLMQGDLSAGELLEGMLDALSGEYDVQMNFLPSREPASHVRELVEKGSSVGWMSGLVLVSCPREVQELVLSLDVPAAVFGGVYATTRRIPAADADHHETGRLMARHLVDQGHRHLGFVTHETWLPGNTQVFEGINEVLADADFSPGALRLRSLPIDPVLVMEELRSLLGPENHPSALICHGRFFADAAVRAADSMGLRIGSDLALVSDSRNPRSAAPLPWPEVRPELDLQAQTAIVGRLLLERIKDPLCQPGHEVIPVRLISPSP